MSPDLPGRSPRPHGWPLYGPALILLALAAPASAQAQDEDGFPVETPHYRVWTDVSPEFSQAVADRMERLWRAYKRLLGARPKKGTRLNVRIFDLKEDFLRYCQEKNGEEPISFIYFHFSRSKMEKREVVGWRVGEYPLQERLAHEGLHQYLRAIVEWPPQWLNEGLAEACEVARIDDRGRFEFLLSHDWIREWHEGRCEGEGQIDVKNLVQMPKDEWSRRSSAYATSWGVCYDLLTSETRSHRKRLRKYVGALSPTATREDNSRQAFAKGFKRFDFASYQDGLVKRMRTRHLAGTPPFRRGLEHFDREEYETAIPLFSKAIFLDDRSHRYLYFRGTSYYSLNDLQQAEADLLGALERKPEYSSAHFVLGKVYVLMKKPEQARNHLTLAKGHEREVKRWLAKLERR